MSVILRRLWIQVSSDRKRVALLGAMLAVGLLLWGRIIITTNIPRQAVAVDEEEAEIVSINADERTRSDEHPITLALQEHPARDPFIVSDRHFPRRNVGLEKDEKQGKSEADASEDLEREEAEFRAQLRRQVERMSLDAVMSGAHMAVISGRTYRLGDDVPAPDNENARFVLTSVQQRAVTLEFDGRRFELRMPDPGVE